MTPEHLMQCLGCKNLAREVSPRMLCCQCEYDYNIKVLNIFSELHNVAYNVAVAMALPDVELHIQRNLRAFNDANPLHVQGH